MKVGNIDEETYVKTSDLRPGIITSEDIFVNTIYPVLRKDTELSPEHIKVLNAFGVKKVKVHERLIVKREDAYDDNEGPMNPDDVLAKIPMKQSRFTNKIQRCSSITIKKSFLDGVQVYVRM